jgi:hypothetical protein
MGYGLLVGRRWNEVRAKGCGFGLDWVLVWRIGIMKNSLTKIWAVGIWKKGRWSVDKGLEIRWGCLVGG